MDHKAVIESNDNNPVLEVIEAHPRLVRRKDSKILVSLLRAMIREIYPRRYFSAITLNRMIKAAGLELFVKNKKARYVEGLEILHGETPKTADERHVGPELARSIANDEASLCVHAGECQSIN